MFRKTTPVIVICVILVLGPIACTVPAPTGPTAMPEVQTVVVTQVVTPTPELSPIVVTATAEPTPIVVTVLVAVTTTPTTPTATPPPPTGTPRPPALTAPPRPRSTPTSAGPLGFSEPTRLDSWQPLPDDDHECRVILQISGGAPPYTVSHDLDVFSTWETNPAIVFKARGCDAIVHTIAVESADGQTVSHDYYIHPPWCKQ